MIGSTDQKSTISAGDGDFKEFTDIDVTQRLSKEDFSDGLLKARVVFGVIFKDEPDDDSDPDITLQDKEGEKEISISWSEENNAVIANGKSFAGYDIYEEVYLQQDASIDDEDQDDIYMRIISISKEEELEDTIRYSDTETEAEEPKKASKKRKSKSSKKAGTEEPKKASKKAKRKSKSSKKSKSSRKRVTEEAEEEKEAETCPYVFSKGKNKGKPCGKGIIEDGMCSKHAKVKAKRGEKEIENFSEDETKGRAMASTTMSKTMMTTLLGHLEDILQNTLKTKYFELAMTAISSDESVAAMNNIIKIHTPKTTKRRCKRDPLKPKGAKSAYIFFSQENSAATRAALKRDHPDWNSKKIFKNTSKALGAAWKNMSEKKKKKFIKLAEEDKKRAVEDLKAYTPSDEYLASVSSSSDSKPRRKSKRRVGPKKALSAYMFFCRAERKRIKAEDEKLDAKETMRELGRRWRELDEDEGERDEYIKLAEEDKIRYQDEKAAWDEEHPEEKEEKEAKPTKKKASKKKKNSKLVPIVMEAETETESEGDEKRSVGTTLGYARFAKDERPRIIASHRDWSMAKVSKKITKKWNKLTEEERQNYTDRANED